MKDGGGQRLPRPTDHFISLQVYRLELRGICNCKIIPEECLCPELEAKALVCVRMRISDKHSPYNLGTDEQSYRKWQWLWCVMAQPLSEDHLSCYLHKKPKSKTSMSQPHSFTLLFVCLWDKDLLKKKVAFKAEIKWDCLGFWIINQDVRVVQNVSFYPLQL